MLQGGLGPSWLTWYSRFKNNENFCRINTLMSGSNAILHMSRTQSTVRKKMATGTFTYNALRTKTLKERIKTQRKIVTHSNSTRAMLLV